MPQQRDLDRIRRGKASGRARLTAVIGFCVIPLVGHEPVWAQDGAASEAVIMTSELHLQPGTDVPLEIDIRDVDKLPPQTIMLLRGLPPGIRLSDGRSFAGNLWVVPANKISGLKASIPAEIAGKSEINVSLTTLEGKPITENHLSLIIEPQTTGALASTPAGGGDNGASSKQQPTSNLPFFKRKAPDRDLALKLLKNGNNSLETGNVLVARQFYQHAAEYGSAEAARLLATTYDAAELSHMKNLLGIQPNAQLAEKWYRIAQELQSNELSVEAR